MTPERAYRLGVRAAMAEQRGDLDGQHVLLRDVVRAATDLWRRGRKDDGNALCSAFDAGRADTEYREIRSAGGVEPGM